MTEYLDNPVDPDDDDYSAGEYHIPPDIKRHLRRGGAGVIWFAGGVKRIPDRDIKVDPMPIDIQAEMIALGLDKPREVRRPGSHPDEMLRETRREPR